MNDSTARLIERLSADAAPVKPLAPPLRRTLCWVAFAAAIVLLAAYGHGFRDDLAVAAATPRLVLEWLAAVLTGLFAAYAVFQVSVPGRSARWAWLPLPALLLWLATLGASCLGDWQVTGAEALRFQGAYWHCARAIVITSLPLGLLLLLMVRHAGVVRPRRTALLGALGAAAFSAAGASLFHAGETALMTLLWHIGAVVVLSLGSWLFSRRLFGWIGYARA